MTTTKIIVSSKRAPTIKAIKRQSCYEIIYEWGKNSAMEKKNKRKAMRKQTNRENKRKRAGENGSKQISSFRKMTLSVFLKRFETHAELSSANRTTFQPTPTQLNGGALRKKAEVRAQNRK